VADENGKLSALMREADLSAKSLARAVVMAAGRAGQTIVCDHTYVSRWLRGGVPRGDVPRFIAEAVGRKVGRRLSLDDIGMGAAQVAALQDDIGLDFPDQPTTAAKTIAELWRADLADAAVLVKAAPDTGAWSQASLRWLVAPPDVDLARRGSQAVGRGDIEMLRSTVDMFSGLDGRFGGGHARKALIQYLHVEVRPLLGGKFTDEVGRELHSAVAESLLLAAWMSYDSGHHGVAQRYFVQALRMAQAGGDRLLGGSILSAMSHQATFLGHYRDAATMARAALTGPAGALTPTLAAQFHAMEARALARLNDARGVDLALSKAERHLARRTADSDPAYIAYFDEIELAAEFGHCFRDLGRSMQVTERGSSSIFGDGMNSRSDFFATMVQAEAFVAQGEIAQGLAVALGALSAGEKLKSARCVQYVREFRLLLTSDIQRLADFKEFDERAQGHRLWVASA
jgi:hypothetical protein